MHFIQGNACQLYKVEIWKDTNLKNGKKWFVMEIYLFFE